MLLIGRLPDRVDVNFFGRKQDFSGPQRVMGYLSRAPLLPAFMIRDAAGHFVGSLGEPIVVSTTETPENSVRAATQAFATQLERQICRESAPLVQFDRYGVRYVQFVSRILTSRLQPA